ncbi:MAG: hypothetical protein Q9192_001199 [Flavoplaca navasiana]
MGPSWDVVEKFTAITGLPENTATDWLKLYNNDPEKAINAWIDDPDLLERKKRSNIYDESQFHTDSTGPQSCKSLGLYATSALASSA